MHTRGGRGKLSISAHTAVEHGTVRREPALQVLLALEASVDDLVLPVRTFKVINSGGSDRNCTRNSGSGPLPLLL
jgi:hypothetical protein